MTKPEAGITALIPKSDVEILDVWDVSGLRGTGSLSFMLDDHFVSSGRTFGAADPPREEGAIYVIPTVLMFAAGFGNVSLGIARSALDTAIELGREKTPIMTTSVLGDLSTTRRQIGEAEATLGSSKAFLEEAVSDLWAEASNNRELTVEARIRLRLAGTHAIRTSADVVDVAYNLAGADSIFGTNPIQRRFQDMHVITQQAQGRMAHYDTTGAFYLGQSPSGFF
jgi:alkylation response protein AidB-like acyl-CoA dehydrogenase